MSTQNFIKEIREFAKPTFIKVISLFILISLIVLGLVVIKNVNSELKIREIASKFQQYKYSILSFNNVYSGLPGDIDNATVYWKEATENGDADKKISFENRETILAWQHLQLAKLMPDEPDNMTGQWEKNKDGTMIARVNSPAGTIENSVYFIGYMERFGSTIIGLAASPSKKGIPSTPILTPEQAYNLDLMIDDGFPSKGLIISEGINSNSCALAGEYKLEKDSVECLVFDKLNDFSANKNSK